MAIITNGSRWAEVDSAQAQSICNDLNVLSQYGVAKWSVKND